MLYKINLALLISAGASSLVMDDWFRRAKKTQTGQIYQIVLGKKSEELCTICG
jgi:hypothetical protein